MNWKSLLERIDPATALAFVAAARNVIDALLIENERSAQAQSPEPRDYRTAGLDRSAPAAGWISDQELRRATQQMSEALAAERWTEGALFAIRALVLIGGVA